MDDHIVSVSPIVMTRGWMIDPDTYSLDRNGDRRYYRLVRVEHGQITGEVIHLGPGLGWLGTTRMGTPIHAQAGALHTVYAAESAEMLHAASTKPAPRPYWYPDDRGGFLAAALEGQCILSVKPLPGSPERWMAVVDGEMVRRTDGHLCDIPDEVHGRAVAAFAFGRTDLPPLVVYNDPLSAMKAAEFHMYEMLRPDTWPPSNYLHDLAAKPWELGMARQRSDVGA